MSEREAEDKKAEAKRPRSKAAAKKSGPQGGEAASKRRKSARPTATACRSRSAKPYGQAGKALDGVRILDFTHVQSGPTCTQLLAYLGADCIKVERPGVGDITRGQLRDVKGADSLYFTMLNGNKRSITIDSKHPQGQARPRRADQGLRRAGGEFRARRARPHGADLGAHPQAQPAHDRRLGQGLRPRPLRGLQGLRERRAMRRRLGLHHRLPRGPAAGHRRADRRQRHRLASRLRHLRRALSAQPHRPRPEGARAPCRTACSTSRA